MDGPGRLVWYGPDLSRQAREQGMRTWTGSVSDYDEPLDHGTPSAARRHLAKGEECARCGVPQDPPDVAADGVVTAGERDGSETGTNWSFDDLVHPRPVTVGDGCSGELTPTSARLPNA